jgi:multidrug resistance efflux pump
MNTLLALALILAGQAKHDPDQFPLALQRSMELDDLDREIQRVHDTALLKRAQLNSSQRLASRGIVSQSDLDRETAELRYQEAREAELIAARAFKAYERELKGMAVPPDERKAYSLLLDWVRKQVAIAQVDADLQASELKRTRALFQRHAVSRQAMEDAELTATTAQATVDLGRSREAQVLLELAARTGEKRFDPDEVHRLKADYLKARVRYFQISRDAARRRLEVARDRSRHGLIPASDISTFERAATDAETSLGAEIKALERHESERPSGPRKRSA